MATRTWFTKRQKQLLELVGKDPNFTSKFYLTGGTALAAVYYNHRQSDDLDFFSPKNFSSQWLRNLLFATKPALKWSRIKPIPVNINGYLLFWNDNSCLKLDFLSYSFKRLKPGVNAFGIEIDSLEDIVVNKLDTIVTRKNIRDYIDLYTIMQNEKLTLKQIVKLHQKKIEMRIEPLALAKNLLQVLELTDYPKMKVSFSRKKLIKFFEDEVKKIGRQIIK